MGYVDALHVYGLSRAGYVPQLFSVRLPNPDVIFELLKRADAKALIYDAAFESILSNSPVPTLAAISEQQVDYEGEALPMMPQVSAEDIAFVFHTSGSTSGSPKLVPCSYKWLDATVRTSYQTCQPSEGRRDVTVWMFVLLSLLSYFVLTMTHRGSLMHIGQTFMLIGSLQHGTCTIRPTVINFSSSELMDMVTRCGLNRLNQFASFLVTHLRNSRSDSKLLSTLSGLDEVLYSGLPLVHDEEVYARQNGIQLKVIASFIK